MDKQGERRGPRGGAGSRRGERARSGAARISAREVARQALSDVVRSGSYVSAALDRHLNTSGLSAEDKRLAASLFYTAVENRLLLEARLASFWTERPEPVVEDILHIAAAQLLLMDRIPDHAAVDEAVKQTRAVGRDGLAALVNGVLRNLIRARDAGELAEIADPAVRYSVAPELARRLIAAYGEEEAEKIMADRPRPSQTIRFNRIKTDAAGFEAYLKSHDVIFERGVVPGAYRCPAAGNLARLDGYRNGYFSIQGESSMLAALAVEPRPGMNVLDACAAPGGKSALIAESMGDVGRVYAWDVHEHRVELIRAAKRRLRLDCLRPAVRDARQAYADFELYMDAVLVDAPCSGLGVIADKPDIKYRFTDAQMESLLPLQAAILENCARFVKVGGLLVYSTCTILPEENERQVAAFLERHPEFAPEPGADYLPEPLRARCENGMAQFLSHRDHVEGFFIARMRRKGV
ncbi:MAG TPA: 16S rRNA (cytosine(967)-C(5))-methyltransferase RsmB [Candidatus Pullichristensenella avicola]|nr:16S rRNA (cytosine(967)-C(5))-methyltransferase RsmB [Candidatus Pullichristensenella avicola]